MGAPEHTIEHLCEIFEHHKSYLLERWDEKEPVMSRRRIQTVTGAGGDHA